MKLFFIKTYIGVIDQKILVYNIDGDKYSLAMTATCPLCDLMDKVTELVNEICDENTTNYVFTNEKEIEDLLLEHNFEIWRN